jgi:inward rectifier potassium channel
VASSSKSRLPGVVVVGAPNAPFRDYHHRFLRAPWWLALSAIVLLFLALNAGFALSYLLTGGVRHARPGSFFDAFYFSVQTMGTIGYGDMYPVSKAANWLVVSEAVVSLILTAVATGLIFSKFSQLQARVVFTDKITVSPMDGVPTMMFRLGNERGNQIVEALLHVIMIRTEHTLEGMTFYRQTDLRLVRDRSQAFTRSWTALHTISENSPLYGMTEAQMHAEEIEFVVSVVGTDDTSLQPVHAQHHYMHEDVLWGARHADVLSEQADGTIILDLTKFHDTMPTHATPEFPYGLKS